MQSSGVPFALPSSTGGWLMWPSISQACGWGRGVCVCVCVCVYLYLQGDSGQGRRKMRLPQHFSYPNWYLSSAQSGEHALGAWMFFHRSTAVSHIYSHVSEHTCLCQALSFPCPWTRFSGTCWEAGSHEEHKSYCLSTCASTPKPQRGPALHSKKSNNLLFKNCHSFCLGLGPGSKVYRRFIIFQKYSLNDRKLSQCHLYGGGLLLPIVTGFPSGLDVPRKERKEKQRETEDGGGGGESKSTPGLCHPCVQKTSTLLT